MNRNTLKIFLIIFLSTLVFYLPIIINPTIILNRNNDLQEYYWPIIFFEKKHILQDHALPLWNNMFFSGTPLLPDPQSLLFYPPALLFLLLPIDLSIIAWFMLHTFLGGLGAYFTARKGLGFSQISSIFTAIFYITFPKAAGFLEAGHLTLVASIAWLPYILWATINLIKSPNVKQSIFLSIGVSGLFFTFPTIAASAGAAAILLTVGCCLFRSHSLKALLYLALGFILAGGLTAITLLPQLEWIGQTTRFILLQDRDVYPKWQGMSDFVKAIYPHLFGGVGAIYRLDSEKWIVNGFFLSILTLIGFLKLKNKFRVFALLFLAIVLTIVLNNISPIYSLLLSSDWYVLSRVSTRNWLLVMMVLVFLAGFGFEKLQRGFKKLAFTLAILSIIEMLFLSWLRLETPIQSQEEKVPESLYQYLKSDTERFWVFCVNRCLSQRDVAKYNLQTIEGYATIYQKNYYDSFIQLDQVFWDKYSSTLPPSSVYKYRQIQPVASILGDHNVKYVISPYTLKDTNFKLVKQFGSFFVFENTLARSRAYFYTRGASSEIEAPITYYSPNKIVIDSSRHKADEVVLAETWSSGWKAKTNGGKRIKVVETNNKLMKVKIEPETQFVELYYCPESYRLGKAISIFTLLAMLSYFLLHSSGKKLPQNS